MSYLKDEEGKGVLFMFVFDNEESKTMTITKNYHKEKLCKKTRSNQDQWQIILIDENSLGGSK